MKIIVCDRCGKHQAEKLPYQNASFPSVNLTIATGPMDTLMPTRIDLCDNCVNDLLVFLGKQKGEKK